MVAKLLSMIYSFYNYYIQKMVKELTLTWWGMYQTSSKQNGGVFAIAYAFLCSGRPCNCNHIWPEEDGTAAGEVHAFTKVNSIGYKPKQMHFSFHKIRTIRTCQIPSGLVPVSLIPVHLILISSTPISSNLVSSTMWIMEVNINPV